MLYESLCKRPDVGLSGGSAAAPDSLDHIQMNTNVRFPICLSVFLSLLNLFPLAHPDTPSCGNHFLILFAMLVQFGQNTRSVPRLLRYPSLLNPSLTTLPVDRSQESFPYSLRQVSTFPITFGVY